MELKEHPPGREALREMYGAIAHRYDLLNSILSLKQADYWRRFAAAQAGLAAGGYVLDVACGTGLLSLELARRTDPGGRVVGVDFCDAMLERARINASATPYRDAVRFEVADADELPFADGSFDCACMAFALRAMSDVQRTLGEMARVIKPGGRVVTLELARPDLPVFKEIYALYLNRLVPLVGRLGTGVREPYDFLARSVRTFPDQGLIRDTLVRLGLADVRYYALSGGVAAVLAGTKPRPV